MDFDYDMEDFADNDITLFYIVKRFKGDNILTITFQTLLHMVDTESEKECFLHQLISYGYDTESLKIISYNHYPNTLSVLSLELVASEWYE